MTDSPLVRRTVVIPDEGSLRSAHAAGPGVGASWRSTFKSKIEVVRDTQRVDAKSILDVMTLAAEPGVEIVLEAQGADAEQAVEELARYIENGFATDETQCQGPAASG